MQKFLFFLTIFLIVAVYLLFNAYTEAVEKNTRLETKKNALEGNINFLREDVHETNERILAADRRVAELEELAKHSKDNIWNYRIDDNDPVIMRLRQD